MRIVLLGGFGFGLYQILWTVGLLTIPAGDSALLIAATPVFTAGESCTAGAATLGCRYMADGVTFTVRQTWPFRSEQPWTEAEFRAACEASTPPGVVIVGR